METKKNEQRITEVQVDEAVNTLKAYFAQERAEVQAQGQEDVSSLFLVMNAGTHHVATIEGLSDNIRASFAGLLGGCPDLVPIFKGAVEFAEDDSPTAQKLKEMAKMCFRFKDQD